MKNPEHFLINDTCINELQTDCAVWPFLAYYIDRIKSIQSPPKISPHEKNIIINGFLKNLASRITNASKNVLASALFAKIESILKVRNSKKIIAFERSVTIREDELLSGLSHGVMGCAYSTYYYNSIIAKDNAVESIFLDFLDWEISAYDECIHNWKDYRRRSQSTKGEFSWSHGLPGNYLVLKHLSDNGVKAAKDFVSNNPPAKYFSFETLLKRPRPVNDSLCHGAYGLINIIKKVYPAALNDHRIYIWANLRNLANQDIRELRVRAADPLGLWVGKVGSLLGSIGLLESGFTFPFLPHEMQYIQQ